MFESFQGYVQVLWNSTSSKDLVQYICLVLVACYGAYLKWRYSQTNLFDRLLDFINDEDERLDKGRAPIIAKIRRPAPGRYGYDPIYSNKELYHALRKLGWPDKSWRNWFGGPNTKQIEQHLAAAAKLSQERLDLAKKAMAVQQEQLATAHFALGSIAAGKADHALALDEFTKGSEFHPNSPEFLEHEGLQLVRVGNSEVAQTKFDEMKTVAEALNDKLAQAWAHRHKAYGHYNKADSSSTLAQTELATAIACFLETNAPPLDVASTWELHGKMRRKNNFLSPAKFSYEQAALIYSAQLGHLEGGVGLERAHREIASINAEIAQSTQPPVSNGDGIAFAPKNTKPSQVLLPSLKRGNQNSRREHAHQGSPNGSDGTEGDTGHSTG